MERRALLAGIATATCGGCLGAPRRGLEPGIDADDLRLPRGSIGTLRLRATAVEALAFGHLPSGNAVTVDVEAAELDPVPTSVDVDGADGQRWLWDPQVRSVDIAVPVNVSDDSGAGTFPYEVLLWSGSEGTPDVTATHAIEITDDVWI